MGLNAGDKAFARRGLARHLEPVALALAFEGGFALAVMILDRENRALPSDALYVAVALGSFAAAFLAAMGLRAYRARLGLARALRDPLEAELPAARPGPEGAWRSLVLACRAEARKEAAARDAAAKAEMDAFIASVHALKTPVTALSLMAQRSIADGRALPGAEVGIEADELARLLDRALGRLRLADFESGSRITRIDAGRAASESVKRHRRILISRGIGVELRGAALVETDGVWLSFILDQLLSNAAKYAAARIRISLSGSGGRAVLEVEDDGPGLEGDDLLRLSGKSAAGSAGAGWSSAPGPATSGYGLYLAFEAARRLGVGLEILGPDRQAEGGRSRGALARLELPLASDPLDDLAPA